MSGVLPFTELFEQAASEVGNRAKDAETERFFKNLVNIVYTGLLPQVREWNVFQTEFDAPIQMIGNYNTGTVTVTNGSSTVTGSGTTFTSAMVGRKFKVSGDDDVYEIATFSSATSITIDRTYNGTTSSSASYEIMDDLMSMDSDFDRLTDEPRIFYRSSGSPQYLDFRSHKNFLALQTFTPGQPTYARIFPDKDSSDLVQIQVTPPPDDDTLFYGEFIKKVDAMTEYVTGTATTTHNSTSVSGTGTTWSTNVSAGDYFRIDGTPPNKGRWVKISSVTNDTALVLSSAYPGTSVTAGAYTICKAPAIDERFHPAILYGACALAASNQDDEAGFNRYARISGLPITILQAEVRKESRERSGTQRMATIYQKSRTFRTGRFR